MIIVMSISIIHNVLQYNPQWFLVAAMTMRMTLPLHTTPDELLDTAGIWKKVKWEKIRTELQDTIDTLP